MKFMLMMTGTVQGCESLMTWPPADVQAHIGFMMKLAEDLERAGELVMAEGLDFPPRPQIVTATKQDEPVVSDGPFAETKEFLAGFWIVEVPSRERAIAIAARASTAPGPDGKPLGIPIEVRQVMAPAPR